MEGRECKHGGFFSHEKQETRLHKLGDFLKGKGFCMVLFLCVTYAIGISGYFSFSGLFALSRRAGWNHSAVGMRRRCLWRTLSRSALRRTVRPVPLPRRHSQSLLLTPRPRRTAPDKEGKAAFLWLAWLVEGSENPGLQPGVFAYEGLTTGRLAHPRGIDINRPAGPPKSACARGPSLASPGLRHDGSHRHPE